VYNEKLRNGCNRVVIIEKPPILSSPDSSENPFYFFFEIKRLKRIAGVIVLKKTILAAPKKILQSVVLQDLD